MEFIDWKYLKMYQNLKNANEINIAKRVLLYGTHEQLKNDSRNNVRWLVEELMEVFNPIKEYR